MGGSRLSLFVICISAVLLLSSCATLTDFFFPEALDKDATLEWRKDMKLEINGKTYRGMALVAKANTYIIKIYPADKRIDRLQWRTCHREDFADRAVERGFWPWSKKDKFFKLVFKPDPIEIERACPLRIEGLAERHRTMSFGMVVFPYSQPHISMGASLSCNGEIKQRGGTSECEGPVGTIHKIVFESKVYQDDRPNKQCPPMKEVKPGNFEFFMPLSECIYVFTIPIKHENGEYLTHKLLTSGYQRIPPPEG